MSEEESTIQDNTQQEFEQFLKERKIDFESLRGTDQEKLVQNADLKRAENILYARLNANPMTFEDNYALHVEQRGDIGEVLHKNCYDKCAQENEYTFLTLTEGLCLRNCITKFGIFYPTLKQNVQYAEYQYLNKQYEEKLKQIDPKMKNLLSDPWQAERDHIFQKHYSYGPSNL